MINPFNALMLKLEQRTMFNKTSMEYSDLLAEFSEIKLKFLDIELEMAGVMLELDDDTFEFLQTNHFIELTKLNNNLKTINEHALNLGDNVVTRLGLLDAIKNSCEENNNLIKQTHLRYSCLATIFKNYTAEFNLYTALFKRIIGVIQARRLQ
jgi:hypothetical protein